MPTHWLLAEADNVPGRRRAEPAAHPQPAAGESEGSVSRSIAHPPCWTPAEDVAPGALLAQLNLGPGKGEVLHLLLCTWGALSEEGEEMDALFALHW